MVAKLSDSHFAPVRINPESSKKSNSSQSQNNPSASGGDKRSITLAVSALLPSNPVDKMPAYCSHNRLTPTPTPGTSQRQLSNCSHINLSKICYVYALFFLFLLDDKHKRYFAKPEYFLPSLMHCSSRWQLTKLDKLIYRHSEA